MKKALIFFCCFLTSLAAAYDDCSVCGYQRHVRDSDFVVNITDVPNLTCRELQRRGQIGNYSPEECTNFTSLIEGDEICGCIANVECSVCGIGRSVTDLDRVLIVGLQPRWTCEQWENKGKNLELAPNQCGLVKPVAGFSCGCVIDDPDRPGICFSERNTVEAKGAGMVRMDKVQIGDYVRARDGTFSRIYSFGHKDPEKEADFLQIYASGLKAPLEVSPEHMVFVSDKTIRAQDVQVGDVFDDRHTVTAIKNVKRRGVFAPVTASGEVVVSEVLVSSYATVFGGVSPAIQKVLSHAGLAPLRLVCGYNFQVCEHETYTDGYSDRIFPIVRFVAKLQGRSRAVQLSVCFVALAVMSLVYVLEKVIVSPLFPSVLILGLIFLDTKIKKTKAKTL